MNNLWNYPDIDYDEAKELVKEGIIKSRLVELDSFYVYKLNDNERSNVFNIMNESTVPIDKLLVTYLVAYDDHPEDEELHNELFRYMDDHPSIMSLLIKGSIYTRPQIVADYYYYKHKTTGISLKDIIESIPKKYPRNLNSIFNVFTHNLWKEGKNIEELIDLMIIYNPDFINDASAFMNDETFFKYIDYLWNVSYVLQISVGDIDTHKRIDRLIGLYLKSGMSAETLLEKYLKTCRGGVMAHYVEKMIIEIGKLDMVKLYESSTDPLVISFTRYTILNQV